MSGTRFELREVRLSAKPETMLTASPNGTVPVLALPGGTVLDESLIIMRWALAIRDPEGWLARDDAELIAMNDGSFKHDLDCYKYPQRYGADAIAHREGGLAFLRELDGRLVGAGQLGRHARGLTDVAILPFVRQFAAVDREWFSALSLPHLQGWLAGHLASGLFETIMMRVTTWSPDDTPVAVALRSSLRRSPKPP